MKILFKRFKFMIILLAILTLIAFIFIQNNLIGITTINYSNDKIAVEFNDFNIVHISDLHNKSFGKNQKKIISKTKNLDASIFVITGDLIDSYSPNIEKSMEYINYLVTLAPVYYVNGNHELRCGLYLELKEKLKNSGVTVLEDELLTLSKNNASVNLIGLTDPSSTKNTEYYELKNITYNKLKNLTKDTSNAFTMLLAHRPEDIDIYSENNIDLAFSGHAHGGQFRIPFIGRGLFAPHQGVFPKYTSGITKVANTSLVVSRGLGNSIFPIRLFNRPEIVKVTLKSN